MEEGSLYCWGDSLKFGRAQSVLNAPPLPCSTPRLGRLGPGKGGPL
jgi:hypothetical protein